MAKYLTRRCIGLHALVLVLVPAFLLAGWWQYHVALGGNDLSWVYTVEWPFFAVYAVYVWWKLIHDESTPFDRLWTAKQRAAADAEGRPLHEIPGWATDKALSREVYLAGRDDARRRSLSGPRREALSGPRREALSGPRREALDVQHLALDVQHLDRQRRRAPGITPAARDREDDLDSACTSSATARDEDHGDPVGRVIDAEVLEVKVSVDEELEAYNRYLFQLSRNGAAKRWGARRGGRHDEVLDQRHPPVPAPVRETPALGPTNGGD